MHENPKRKISFEIEEMAPLAPEQVKEFGLQVAQDVEQLFVSAYAFPTATNFFQTSTGEISFHQEMVVNLEEGENDLNTQWFVDVRTGRYFERTEGAISTTVLVGHHKYRKGIKDEDYIISIERTVPHTGEVFVTMYEFEFYVGGTILATVQTLNKGFEGEKGVFTTASLTEYDTKELTKEFTALHTHMSFHHEFKALGDSLRSDE